MAYRKISGFLKKAKQNASGKKYRGRFTCHEVQWTGEGPDAFATFTISAEELADAAESGLLWTDQDVQRGILPGSALTPARELSVAAGYPDPAVYIFDAKNADDMVQKLLDGDRLFLSPLVWNLRPSKFEAFWDEPASEIYIYTGKIYLPDSHHRQQAILKAVRAWRESPKSYPRFSGAKQFKIELYFLSREDEGNYFFDKNQRPKPTAKSKAYDLTTLDDLSLLAKRTIDKSHALRDNVNRVTDRLNAKNPQVMTLSTLREMMKGFSSSEQLDDAELEGLATVAARFYDLLAGARAELGHLEPAERRKVRETLVVDSAVMMHGYAALMREFNDAIGESGMVSALRELEKRLSRLKSEDYQFDQWSGDLFEKKNPLWQRVGLVKPGRDSRNLTVLNTGGARSEAGRVLKQLLATKSHHKNLEYLAKR